MESQLDFGTHISTLSQTCLQCRMVKKKCDGAYPRCARCERKHLGCESAEAVARRRRVDILNERLFHLESRIAFLSTEHERDRLVDSLYDKLRLLDDVHIFTGLDRTIPLAFFPHSSPPLSSPSVVKPGKVSHVESVIGYQPLVRRPEVCALFGEWQPNGSEMPRHISLCLTRLFLPFRLQFHFYMDVSFFLQSLARPSRDLTSPHPALMNAIYLAACRILGGRYAAFEPYFLQATRKDLAEALRDADRLTHFMWASVILGAYYEMSHRTTESYATISSCATFALACGLDCVAPGYTSRAANHPILPPATSLEEAKDHVNLAHAIYIVDRSLSMTSGFPSVFSYRLKADPLPPLLRETTKHSIKSRSDIDNYARLIESEIPINVKMMLMYQHIERLALNVQQARGFNEHLSQEHSALVQAVSSLEALLPSLEDPWGIEPLEALSFVNPHLLVAHTVYHGSRLILYSLVTGKDPSTQLQVFTAAQSLVDLCSQVRGNRGVRRVQAPLILLPHMMNAARVLATYLQSEQTRSSEQRLASCCNGLIVLIDFMLEVMVFYPKWGHVLGGFRGLLPKFPESLRSHSSE